MTPVNDNIGVKFEDNMCFVYCAGGVVIYQNVLCAKSDIDGYYAREL